MQRDSMITAVILARRNGESLHTVRHYTRIGLLKPTRNPDNNYKIYDPSDEIRLRFICAVKEFGLSLNEIALILDESLTGKSPCPRVKEIISRHVEENRHRIKEMKQTQKHMEKALSEWSDPNVAGPDGDSVKRLVESLASKSN